MQLADDAVFGQVCIAVNCASNKQPDAEQAKYVDDRYALVASSAWPESNPSNDGKLLIKSHTTLSGFHKPYPTIAVILSCITVTRSSAALLIEMFLYGAAPPLRAQLQ